LAELLQNLPKPQAKPAVKVRPTITIEAMIERLRTKITQQMTTYFSEIRQQETEHKNVIVGFLAILELFKQGDILVVQSTRFADIEVSAERQGTPQYY
jgi:chromatin segregation and condensation protein Rec8/ScpA/Scc1 (kleisin family)